MSILNITPSNFENGLICISTNVHTESELQTYIDEFEVVFLKDMLGCELYDLFVADLDNGVPVAQIYKDIFNPFCIDKNNCGVQRVSEGIIKMIEKFIYWEYTRDQKVKNTTSGNVVNDNESSRETHFPESRIYSTYNQGIKSYCAIQWFICENLSDYPKFNGLTKRKTSWL